MKQSKISKIQELLSLFASEFPNGWLDSFQWDNEEDSEESYCQIRNKIEEFHQESFYLLASSILSGEYILRGNIVNDLIAFINRLYDSELKTDESNILKNLNVKEFNNLTKEYIQIIQSYRYLLADLDNKYELNHIDYIVNAYRKNSDVCNNSFCGLCFPILITITRIDHLLSSDKHTITKLILCHNDLEEIIKNPIITSKNKVVLSILNEKCLFLLKKLLIDDNRDFDFLIDFKHHHYDTANLRFIYLDKYDRYFEFYRTEAYSNENLGRELDRKSYENKLSIGLHTLLIKYYKDSNGTDKSQIDNILSDFNELYKRLMSTFSKRPFDKYALRTMINYMYNCNISYKMRNMNTSYSFENLQDDINEIIRLQNSTGIFNFYPFRKAILWLKEYFESHNTLSEMQSKQYRELLSLCIEKFEKSIQWCKEMCFFPIQNTYSECITKVDDFGPVFVASSFCRPVKYQNLRDELNEYKNLALSIDNQIAIREDRIKLEKLKLEIENSKNRQIEILSFFSAVITFIFGTIGFFAENKNNDFIHLVYSIFGLGAILLIFVCGIHLVTMKKEDSFVEYFKHPRTWFCIITLLACFILIVWMFFSINNL